MNSAQHHLVGTSRFRVEDDVLETERGTVKLEHRAARTLALLCAHRGSIMTRERILEEVWQGRSVSDNSVAIVIADLRRALGDRARDAKIITTIPKRGYRLENSGEAQTASPVERMRSGRWRRLLAAKIGAATLLVGAGMGVALRTPDAATTIIVEPVRNDTGTAAYLSLSRALHAVMMNDIVGSGRFTALAREQALTTHLDLRLRSRLILWAGAPALSISVADARGRIRWSGIAEAPAGEMAHATSVKLKAFLETADVRH